MEEKKQLKKAVKEFATLGRAIRTEKIRSSSGPARARAWDEKRAVGSQARSALLAYAFVRGRVYRSCEPKAKADAFEYVAKGLASTTAEVLLALGLRTEGNKRDLAAELFAWMRAEAAPTRQAA